MRDAALLDMRGYMLYNNDRIYDGRGAHIPEEYIRRSQRRAQNAAPTRAEPRTTAQPAAPQQKPRTAQTAPGAAEQGYTPRASSYTAPPNTRDVQHISRDGQAGEANRHDIHTAARPAQTAPRTTEPGGQARSHYEVPPELRRTTADASVQSRTRARREESASHAHAPEPRNTRPPHEQQSVFQGRQEIMPRREAQSGNKSTKAVRQPEQPKRISVEPQGQPVRHRQEYNGFTRVNAEQPRKPVEQRQTRNAEPPRQPTKQRQAQPPRHTAERDSGRPPRTQTAQVKPPKQPQTRPVQRENNRQASAAQTSPNAERRRDIALRKQLRHMHAINTALRFLCTAAMVLMMLLWPSVCAPDDGELIKDGGQKVVLPVSMATAAPEPTTAPTEALMPTPEPTPVSITISAAGDCTLGYDPRLGYSNSLPEELERQDGDYGYFFRGVLPVFASDDLTIVNLECALTKSDDKVEGKTFCFKGDPLYRNMLLEGSIEVVSLGNNHSRDYKSQGFNDTVEALRLAGIGFAVNGVSCIEEVNGVRVGFLSYKNNTPELSTLKSDIESLRDQNCAIVICAFHWGEEYRNVANSTQTKLGRAAVDYGADLVIGHHPHVIGSIEKYNGKYICYSLGNFCFGGNRNPEDKDTFIFRQTFTVSDDGAASDAGIEIVPCRISSTTRRNDYQPTIYGEEDAKRVLKRLNEYSAPLKYGAVLDESVLKWDWQLEGQ